MPAALCAFVCEQPSGSPRRSASSITDELQRLHGRLTDAIELAVRRDHDAARDYAADTVFNAPVLGRMRVLCLELGVQLAPCDSGSSRQRLLQLHRDVERALQPARKPWFALF